jgi:hypothetical protein
VDTLKSIRDEVLGWIDEVGDSGVTADNVDNAIRQAHTQRVTSLNWPFMLYPKQTFSLVQSQQIYSLHQEYHRPLYFYNQTTREFLEQIPARQFTDDNLNWIDGTTNNAFTLWGMAPVKAQPTSASVVTIVSDSASDTTAAKNIIVRGETASGIETDTLTPNGTSSVAGTKSFTTILNVTLSAAWAGKLTMTSNSGAVTNLTLAVGEFGRQYQQLRLLWVPGSADVIEYEFFRKPSPLTNDYDVLDIPYPHGKICVWDTLLLMAAYDNQVEGGRLQVWIDEQKRAEAAMRQSFLEPQSLKSRGRYVKYRGD